MSDIRPYRIKFGGWYDGDNYKPGRGWYFICEQCRLVGLGQLLPQSAVREAERHLRRCSPTAGGNS